MSSIISPSDKIARLNYIGSKFQLIDWISSILLQKTQWESFKDRTIADLFAGTGVVSYFFRKNGAIVVSNDAEAYSSIITHAFTRSVYTSSCASMIEKFQTELNEKQYESTIGFITTHYSPYAENERKFFTIDNAKRIDYLRIRIEECKSILSEDEYMFLLASILLAADAVSNVPAVYGCYLKQFKSKATKPLVLQPVHTYIEPPPSLSKTYHMDVLDPNLLSSFTADAVYLDPPYNERQYSKNYFPLNVIAKQPKEENASFFLKGKTGIPSDCFLSPFCKKESIVEEAFDKLFQQLNTTWIFISYNSESTLSKEKMLKLMEKYGEASVEERDYKRFKSFEYNKDVCIKEYLFCLKKHPH